MRQSLPIRTKRTAIKNSVTYFHLSKSFSFCRSFKLSSPMSSNLKYIRKNNRNGFVVRCYRSFVFYLFKLETMLNPSFVCSKTPIVAVTYRKITEIRCLLHTSYVVVRNNLLRVCLLCACVCGLAEIAASPLASRQLGDELIKCDNVASVCY